MEENGIWCEDWKVPAFMVDTNQRIRLKGIADIFQELANNHANYRNVGFEDMKASGKFWVLNRQALVIEEWPIWEQTLRVESWISMMKGPFSLRNFAMFDTTGNVLVTASYLWTSIDRAKMRPVAFPAGDFPIIEERNFEVPNPHKFKIEGAEKSKDTYTVRDSDLDILGHTNNATYLEWASNMMGALEIDYHRIDANYMSESFKGQQVQMAIIENESTKWSLKVSNAENEALFRLKLT